MNSKAIIRKAEEKINSKNKLSQAQTVEIISRYQKNKNQKDFLEIVYSYIMVFHKPILNYSKLDGRLYDDLIQETVILIEKAMMSYDATKGMKFSVYLKSFFGGELSRRFREHYRMIRLRSTVNHDLKNLTQYNQLRIASALNEIQDISDFYDDDILVGYPSQLIYHENTEDSLDIKSLKKMIIEIANEVMTENERYIIIENLIKERSKKDIAVSLERSYQYVSITFKTGLVKLVSELKNRGVTS